MTTRISACALAALLLLCASLHAGAPGRISFQGLLADSAGAPVANDSWSVVFTIYDAAAAGTSVWTETQNVTTSGGLFTVLLGAVNPLHDSVFNDATRYLGIAVNGDPEMTPRTPMLSAPYAQRISTIDGSTGGAVSGDVDVTTTSNGNGLALSQLGLGRGGFFQIANAGNTEPAIQGTHVGAGPGGSFFSDGGGPGITASASLGIAAELYGALNTYGDEVTFSGADSAVHIDASAYMLRTFGSDGLEQTRLWGSSYGELRLNDNTGNDLTAMLSAGANSGGTLSLMDGTGSTQITLAGGNTGDASAVLPQNAINRAEILDEPGIAGVRQGSSLILPLTGTDTISIRTITVPTSGYIVATAFSQVSVSHQENFATSATVGIVPPGGTLGSSPRAIVNIPGLPPDGQYGYPVSITAVFDVTAGAHQFRLEGSAAADFGAGGATASRSELTLLFVPTLYGTVNPNNLPAPPNNAVSADQEQTEAEEFNRRRIQDELTAIQSQLESLQNQLQTTQD